MSDAVTRSSFYRAIHKEEGLGNTAGWLLFTCARYVAAWAAVGPARLIALTAYGVWWLLSPRVGPLRGLPFALASVLLSALGTLYVLRGGTWGGLYVFAQLVLGSALTAWRVRLFGWAAAVRVDEKARGEATGHKEADDHEEDTAPERADEQPAPLMVLDTDDELDDDELAQDDHLEDDAPDYITDDEADWSVETTEGEENDER